MATARNLFALTYRVSTKYRKPLLSAADVIQCRSISAVQNLAKGAQHERRQTRGEGSVRPKKHNQYAHSPRLQTKPNTKKRATRSHRRDRAIPPRDVVLPDLGITSRQLGALAKDSEDRIFKCAKELDDSVYDVKAMLSPALVELVAEELHLNVIFRQQTTPLFSPEEQKAVLANSPENRMPVITVMGHVDHGKTSLLDALRNSDVAKQEIGGITQSVAAFKVPISAKSSEEQQSEPIFATFIDTPGHAAFKAMRVNGTVGTDIVILVVAADDGVMPQTIEAVELARSENVPIIVAVNKCDMPGADPEKVRFQLLERLGINTEQLGGDVQCIDISAKTGSNLSLLLEAISLQAELLDLRTNSQASGHGICLESRIDRALGLIATVIIRMGTMHKGDYIVFQSPKALHGNLYGHIRGIIGSDSAFMDEAGPGTAVGIVGIKETIPPGAELRVLPSEREARSMSQKMILRNSAAVSTIQLANSLYEELVRKREAGQKEGAIQIGSLSDQENTETGEVGDDVHTNPRSLVVLIKGDVKGSADAVEHCIQALGSPEVPIRIIGAEVGDVNEKDVQLAAATNKIKGNTNLSMIIAFNVRTKASIAKIAKRAGLPILEHSLIYHLEDEMKERIENVLGSQETLEEVLGRASVVRVFQDGAIAGCCIEDGSISEGDTARVMRFPEDHSSERIRQEVYTGRIDSIKQFAKTVRSVKKGSECGVSFQGWSEFLPGDHIECISVTKPNT